MLSGKVDLEKALKCRRKLIDDILVNSDVSDAIQNYSCSPEESPWIIKAIVQRSREHLELACDKRAREII